MISLQIVDFVATDVTGDVLVTGHPPGASSPRAQLSVLHLEELNLKPVVGRDGPPHHHGPVR